MKVGVVGVGEMGAAIAGHLKRKGHEVCAFDIDAARLQSVAGQGIATVTGLKTWRPGGIVPRHRRYRRTIAGCDRYAVAAREQKRPDRGAGDQQPQHHGRAGQALPRTRQTLHRCTRRVRSIWRARRHAAVAVRRRRSRCGVRNAGADGLQPQGPARRAGRCRAARQGLQLCSTGSIVCRITRHCCWPSASAWTPSTCAKCCSNVRVSI